MMIYTLPGLYNTDQAKKIKEALQGQTYYDFNVEYGGEAHNNTINVSTYQKKLLDIDTLEDFKDTVIFYIANLV